MADGNHRCGDPLPAFVREGTSGVGASPLRPADEDPGMVKSQVSLNRFFEGGFSISHNFRRIIHYDESQKEPHC